MCPRERYQPSEEELKKAEEIFPEEERLKLVDEELRNLKNEYERFVKLSGEEHRSGEDMEFGRAWGDLSRDCDSFKELYEKIKGIYKLEFRNVPELDVKTKQDEEEGVLNRKARIFDQGLYIVKVSRAGYDDGEGGYEVDESYRIEESNEVLRILEEKKEDLLREISKIDKAREVFEGKDKK